MREGSPRVPYPLKTSFKGPPASLSARRVRVNRGIGALVVEVRSSSRGRHTVAPTTPNDGLDWQGVSGLCRCDSPSCSSLLTMPLGGHSRHDRPRQDACAALQRGLRSAMREPPGPAPQGHKAWRLPRRTLTPCTGRPRRNRAIVERWRRGSVRCRSRARPGRRDLGGRSPRPVAQLPPHPPRVARRVVRENGG